LNRPLKRPARLPAGEASALVAHLYRRLEAERADVARRLHSGVAGVLAAARLDLSRLAGRAAVDPGLSAQLRQVDRLLEQVIGDARTEMQRLHPALLDHFGLAEALRHRVGEICRGCGAGFVVDLPQLPVSPAPEVALAAYRVVETLLSVPGLRRATARLHAAGPLQLLSLEVESDGSPDADTCADLRALQVWLEGQGARWREAREGPVLTLELRLPQS
jgi:signal transduction histidine kinase